MVSSAAQTNTATITQADQFDTNPNNNSSSVTETPQRADLGITKTVSNATPHLGDTIPYSLIINNLGPDAATNVTANEVLPAGLTFLSSAPSQGSYDSATGVWLVGAIGNLGQATLQVTAQVSATGTQTNTANVSADQFDPNLNNNQASASATPLSSLSGNVYVDANNDGIRQGGESGVGSVTVSLSGTNDLNQSVSATTTTAPDGTYGFPNLRPGTYNITDTPPSQFTTGKTKAGSQGGTAGATSISNITLGAGFNGIGYNFGELGTTLSGEVFVDANRNAALDSGEVGLGGVTVTLQDPSGAVIAITVTPVGGVFTFANLPSGNYRVVETAPNGYGISTPTTLAVTLPLTGLNGQNFGVTTGALSGNVFADANDNGRRDPGEVGFAGIAVTLSGQAVTGRTATQTVITAGDGSYRFTGIVGGSYSISEGPVPGFFQGFNAVGTVNGAPNGVLGPGPNVISSINLPGGSQGINYNFAELTVAASSGIETAIIIPGVPAPPVSVSNFGKYQLLGSSAATLTANITYVNGLYHELLQRAPDQGGIDSWVYWLQTGALSRLAVAEAVDHSAEHRGLQVDHFYQLFLHRQADPAGRAGWVNYLVGGGAEYTLAVSFLTSTEYTSTHVDNSDFLTGLYLEVLGRVPDAGGMAGWLAQLQGGAGRAAVANAFLTSTEAYRRIVDQSYIEYLRRQADPGGEQGFIAALQRGDWAPESIAELFLASDEFYQNPH